MTEQARPFKNINKIETFEAPEVVKARPAAETPTFTREVETPPENPAGSGVLDKLLLTGGINWEKVAWVSLITLAVIMHLVNLGPRAMHHDESIHAKFSYDMFRGTSVYKYDPTFHGPLLYYMVSLSYFLFGAATETTARLGPAFYGIALVAICFFLRPLIGRVGAFTMGLFMLFSPSMLYYGRSLRHDIFATTGELLFIIAFFRFIQNKPGHKSYWLPIAGLGLLIFYASHEMVFINVGALVLWLGLVFVFELVALPGSVKNRVFTRKKALDPPIQTSSPGYGLEELDPPLVDETSSEFTEPALESEEILDPHPEAIGEGQTETTFETPVEDGSNPIQTPAAEPLGDRVLGNWGLLSLVLFGFFTLAVLVGSIYQFTPQPGTNGPDAFGVPKWLLTIPPGIIISLFLASALGGFLGFGFSRLEGKNIRLAWLVTLPSLVILGTLGLLTGLRAQVPVGTEAKPLPVFNGTPVSTTDVYLFGMYQLPRILFNLELVIVASLVLGLLTGWFFQRRLFTYTRQGKLAAVLSFFAVWLSASLISLRFALADKTAGIPKGGLFLAGPEVDKWVAYVFNGFFVALLVGLIAGWLVSLAERIPDESLAGSAIFRGALRIARQPRTVGGFILGFGILYILLFSNFFFNLAGLADGIFRGVEYWGEQHGKRRLDEPWFYYPIIMLVYEILPVIFGLAALFTFPIIFLKRAVRRGRIRLTVRGLFIGYTLWWSVLSLIIYSIAGEKAPWLNMQIVLPFALAASAFLEYYFSRFPWRSFWNWSKGPLFTLLFALDFVAVLVLVGLLINLPASGSQRTLQLVEGFIVIMIIFGLFGACFWLWRTGKVAGRVARASVVLFFTLLLAAYTVKSTVALNYDHPDTATEILIYVQTTPEIPLFVQRLDRLSRDLRDTYKTIPAPAGTTQPDPTNSRGLPVLLTNEVAWPLEWYLREYTDKNYLTPDLAQNDKPALSSMVDGRGNNYVVIAVSEGENTAKLQQQLQGQYTPHTYKFRWWFPEDDTGYGGLGKDITKTDWNMIGKSFTEQPFAGRLWRFLMYRQLWNPLESFNMVVYVRNDIDPNWGLNETSGQPAADTNPTQSFGLFESTQPGNKNGQFRTPRDIAVAPDGTILVLDSENARVQRFDKDGKFLGKFGSSGKDDGKFALAQNNSGPSGLTVDEDGNIYVADSWNYRIQKFDKDGKFLLKWGDGKDTGGDLAANQASPAVFYGPRELAYDPLKKELYVADTGNRRIVVYDKTGKFIRQFGSKGSGPGQFNEPVGVAVSPDSSKIYVTDLHNKRIQVLDPNGNFISEIKQNWNDQVLLAEPFVKVDKSGNLLVSNPSFGQIIKYDPNGSQLEIYDSAKGIFLTNPVGLAIDPKGNILVADARRNAVIKITP